jgi:hypothetical protein
MSTLKPAVAALLAALWVSLALADTTFVAGVDDLPLMPGLTEVPGAGTVFDKPGGRIVEAYATGRGIDVEQVTRFYVASLPQLGWQHRGNLLFERAKERLQLTLNEDAGTLTVRFDLAPR